MCQVSVYPSPHTSAHEAIQQYCAALTSVRKDALEEANTDIVVIGCGEPKIIANYRGMDNLCRRNKLADHLRILEITGFTGPIYTDQSLSLFKAFKFDSHLQRPRADQPKREYIQSGLIGGIVKSLGVRPSLPAYRNRCSGLTDYCSIPD
jgi:hypothetical protein